jgi:hypothetical protein
MAREKNSEDPGLDRSSPPVGSGGGGEISSSFEDTPLLHRMMAAPRKELQRDPRTLFSTRVK